MYQCDLFSVSVKFPIRSIFIFKTKQGTGRPRRTNRDPTFAGRHPGDGSTSGEGRVTKNKKDPRPLGGREV